MELPFEFFECQSCDYHFCIAHELPENHDCSKAKLNRLCVLEKYGVITFGSSVSGEGITFVDPFTGTLETLKPGQRYGFGTNVDPKTGSEVRYTVIW